MFTYLASFSFTHCIFYLSFWLLPLFCFLSPKNLILAYSLSFFYLFSPSLSPSPLFSFTLQPFPPAHLSAISLPLLFHSFLFLHSSLSDLFIIMPRLISSLLSPPLPNHSPILSPILLSYLSSFFYSILSYKLASLSFYFLLSLLCLSPSLSLSLT